MFYVQLFVDITKEGERERVREREINQNKCIKYSIGTVISGNMKPHNKEMAFNYTKSASIYIYLSYTHTLHCDGGSRTDIPEVIFCYTHIFITGCDRTQIQGRVNCYIID